MSMIYAVIIICPGTVANKLVDIHGVLFAGGTFILPLFFWLGCIITEAYGYDIYKKITWYAIIGQFSYTFLLFLIIKLPSPSYWHHQNEYNFVIGQLPKMFMAHFIILPAAAFLNSYIISRWKILVKGRIFVIRSIGSSLIGELVYAILICLIVFYGTLPLNKILITAAASFLTKAVYSVLLSYPAVFIANFIRKKEGIDAYDYGINYNPFT